MNDNPSIKSKFVNGVLWGIIEKFASLVTGFIITLVLARILTPSDYGLVNMIYIFTVLGTVLLDGGFGQAIIQRKNISDKDVSSVFYINLILSVIIYAILFVCAPLIANFYNQQSLINISRAVFLTIPINSFCVIQHCLLTKELKVKQLTYVSIISAVCSGIAGIIMAVNGLGVWALVTQSVSYQFVRAICLWIFSSWRPVLRFSSSFIKSIWSFSMNLLGVFTLASIFQNIYTIIIGKIYNVSDVGYYNQAFRMQTVATSAITSSIQRVAFPAFAAYQDNLANLKNAFRKVTVITMTVYFPIMMALIVVSKNLFEVLLTDKWLMSVPMFCLLCVAEAFYPLNNINSSVLKALGKGHKYFTLNLVNYSVITICIFLTYKFGILILLSGYAISALIRSITSMIICGKEICYSLTEQLKDLKDVFIIAILTCIVVFIADRLPLSNVLCLIISIILGATTFILSNIFLKTSLYQEILRLKKK